MPVDTHPKFFHELNSDVNLYRYMDFIRFESLIKESALFFCKTSVFDDPWEGTYPLVELKHQKEQAYYNQREIFKNYSSQEELDSLITNDMKYLQGGYENIKNIIFVNCWMHDTHESYAMWKLYSKEQNGILIKSTYENIFKALDQNVDYNFTMSRVFYLNYESDHMYKGVEEMYNLTEERKKSLFSLCITDPFLQKRKHFEHEKEYRIILKKHNHQSIAEEKGIFVNINLNVLIDEIILSPNCDTEFENKVKSTLSKFGIEKKILRSKIEQKPYSLLDV